MIELDRESRHSWHKSRSVHECIIKIQEDICMFQILSETSRKIYGMDVNIWPKIDLKRQME